MPVVYRRCFAAVGLALSMVALSAGAADDAKSVFDSLFAAKIKAVAGSADRADDVALAKDMLALAKSSANEPALLALLCEAAHDLGARHADGYAVAAEAMTLLAETVEAGRPLAREKLVALLMKQSTIGKADEREAAGEAMIDLLLTTGDEKAEKKQYAEAAGDYRRAVTAATQKKTAALDDAKAKLEFALTRDRTMKQLSRLQEKLLKDADSATAEEIVRLYVIELDDPAAAKDYLNRVKDETLKTLIPLAAEPVEQTKEDDALRLGEWYHALAKESRTHDAPARRGASYLARFIELHASTDLARTKAAVMLKELNDRLASTASTIRPKALDLLALIEVGKDAVQGAWRLDKTGLEGPKDAPGRLQIPVAPTGNYELKLRITRIVGGGALSLFLPIGNRQVRLFIDGAVRNRRASGLTFVNGKWWLDDLSRHVALEKGERKTIVIAVTAKEEDATIRVHIDGLEAMSWSGRQQSISVDNDWTTRDRSAIGVGLFNGGFVIHAATLTKGEVKSLR